MLTSSWEGTTMCDTWFCQQIFDHFYDPVAQVGLFCVMEHEDGIALVVAPNHNVIIPFAKAKSVKACIDLATPEINAYRLMGILGEKYEGKKDVYL